MRVVSYQLEKANNRQCDNIFYIPEDNSPPGFLSDIGSLIIEGVDHART